MKEAPKEWRVDNGAFVGFTCVLREMPGTAVPGKMLATKQEDWLPYACDLRAVNEMKVRGFDDEEASQTSLYHNGTLIAMVNAPFSSLIDHWISMRHLYDGPEFYDPGHPSNS